MQGNEGIGGVSGIEGIEGDEGIEGIERDRKGQDECLCFCLTHDMILKPDSRVTHEFRERETELLWPPFSAMRQRR